MTAGAARGAPGGAVLLVSVQENVDVVGLKYVHAALRAAGFSSTLLCLPGGAPADAAARARVAAFARERRPLFVGVSLMAVEFEAARTATALLREATGAPVVWGGSHPTLDPEVCLAHADLVLVGEGEGAAVALARTLAGGGATDDAPNLVRRGPDGALRRNPLLPLVEDLDELPAIAHLPPAAFVLDRGRVVPLDGRQLRRHGHYGGAVYSVISSRGCPFRCTYCCNDRLSALYGARRIRRRSVTAVVAEIEAAVHAHPGIRMVNFHDDSFLTNRAEELRRFAEEYRARVGRPFLAKSVPRRVDRDALLALKAAGLAWINIGLQSGSDRICQEVYARSAGRDDFLRAAAVVREAGVAAWYDVILDNPFETDEDRLETIETLARTPRPFYPKLFSLALYPGTALRERAEQEGLAVEDARTKDYARYGRHPLNDLTRLSAFLPPRWTARLVRRYRAAGGNAPAFRRELAAARIVSGLLIEPLTYWRLARLSRHGSIPKALASLPLYAGDGLRRYLHQFRATGRR
jgi:radical SAM superfamily enzyme YgiQ (UPF0313 family)